MQKNSFSFKHISNFLILNLLLSFNCFAMKRISTNENQSSIAINIDRDVKIIDSTLSPDGNLVAIQYYSIEKIADETLSNTPATEMLCVHNAHTGEPIWENPIKTSPIFDVRCKFTRDSKSLLVIAGKDDITQLYDSYTSTPKWENPIPHFWGNKI